MHAPFIFYYNRHFLEILSHLDEYAEVLVFSELVTISACSQHSNIEKFLSRLHCTCYMSSVGGV